jgi:hypothetical protein
MADSWQALLDIADRLEPAARQAFLDAIAALRDQIDLAALSQAIVEGGALTVELNDVGEQFRAQLEHVLDVAQKAFVEVGQHTAADLTTQLGTPLRFDIVNPLAVSAARQSAASLVVEITQETLQAIRAVIVRGFNEGMTRREASALIRPVIGLTERQSLAVINYRFGLLEQHMPGERVASLADRYAAKLLRERSATIARTEIMTFSNAGQHAAWQQAVDRKLLDPEVERQWVVTPDDRLCKFCRAMANQKRTLTQDFTDSRGRRVLHPPLHPRCRCVLKLLIRSRRTA